MSNRLVCSEYELQADKFSVRGRYIYPKKPLQYRLMLKSFWVELLLHKNQNQEIFCSLNVLQKCARITVVRISMSTK